VDDVVEVTVRRRFGVMVVAGLMVLATGCLHEIGGLAEGVRFSRAAAINDHGMIVGTSATANGRQHAFAREEDGPLVDLTPDSEDATEAAAVDSTGVVVGTVKHRGPAGDEFRVFVWSREDGLEVLDPPTGILSASAVDSNDRGQVLVDGKAGSEPYRAYLWDRHARRYTEVPPLVPGGDVIAAGLNNRGAVVATAVVLRQDHLWAPAIWDEATPTGRELPQEVGLESLAEDINDAGAVVGHVFGGGVNAAAYWAPDGAGPVRLAGEPGNDAFAVALNESGQIVGYRFEPDTYRPIAVVWRSPDGPRLDLADRGEGAMPAGLDRSGRTVGFVDQPDGRRVAVWWDPPAPPEG
jgi:probable HAF family extracellular repeat protein